MMIWTKLCLVIVFSIFTSFISYSDQQLFRPGQEPQNGMYMIFWLNKSIN